MENSRNRPRLKVVIQDSARVLIPYDIELLSSLFYHINYEQVYILRAEYLPLLIQIGYIFH